ncbi:hypothetical protein N0V84_005261 [Fusarium piperis]|uniref:Uncharacterized protein n=1 Tax=Fusarium piperis TaxID=1435070 RepID=A0A9W9BQS6_9HYPO|nr:hypothetical protein N0V84_005261 [Fusarium piperis]
MVDTPDDLARERNRQEITAHHYAAPAVFYPPFHPGTSQHIHWGFFIAPEARGLIASNNEARLELAKKLGKTLDDLVFDPDELAWKWDGFHCDLVQAAIDRQLPTPAPAPLFHDPDEESERPSDDEVPTVTLPVVNLDIISGALIDQITDLISTSEARALDWDYVTEAMWDPALKRHVTQALRNVWVFLLKELEQTRELLKDPATIDATTQKAVMRTLPLHVLRVAGALSAHQVGSVNVLDRWNEYLEPCKVSKTLQDAHAQIQILKTQLDNPSSWAYAFSTAVAFYNSNACVGQIEMLGQLERLLEVDVRQDGPGSPDLYSEDG